MTFSIVIPARNGEKFLYDTIISALAQKRPADEIIVIDDASVDKTAEIACLPKFEGKVLYRFNPEATGFADAWNRAATFATSDFVTILHQDDLLHEDYLLYIEKAVAAYPDVKHFYAACNYIDASGNITKVPPYPHSLEPKLNSGEDYARRYLAGVYGNNHIHRCPGVTTSREILLNRCNYRKEAGQIADDDFFLRIGEFTDILGISEPLACFRHHSYSVTGRLDNLTRTLAEDYLFQVRQYAKNRGILDSDTVSTINLLAVRFINQLRFRSVLSGDDEAAKAAHTLKVEFERAVPDFFEQKLPSWGRYLWKFANSRSYPAFPEKLYVAAIGLIIKLRG